MWDKTIPIGINAVSGEELTISISYRTSPADLKIYLEIPSKFIDKFIGKILIPQTDIEGVGRYFIHTSTETMSSDELSSTFLNVYKEVNTNYINIEGLATQSSNTIKSIQYSWWKSI